DNKSMVQAAHAVTPGPSQHLTLLHPQTIEDFLTASFFHRNEIAGTPDYLNIKRNECADQLAKEASKHNGSLVTTCQHGDAMRKTC
ncbi:uncharacterized protein F5147DRAFT_590347, partial [Suillus discolor]